MSAVSHVSTIDYKIKTKANVILGKNRGEAHRWGPRLCPLAKVDKTHGLEQNQILAPLLLDHIPTWGGRDDPVLKVYLLGGFRLLDGERVVTTINTPRLQALLAYLALHRHTPQPRAHVAFLFWPDSTEAQARTNLRYLIHQLRQALPQADQFLHTSDGLLQWQTDAPLTLDVADFEQALTGADQAERTGNLTETRATLERAISLYQGDLLPSCYDDWLLSERERLSQMFSAALERLFLLLETERDYRPAIRYVQRLLQHDPLQEATYRHLMRIYALSDDRAGALRVYHNCVTILQREMNVEPSPATYRLYQRLLNLEAEPATKLPVATTPLVGRQQAWQTLLTTWHNVGQGPSKFVLIAGEAGLGKTRLAEELSNWVNRQGFLTAKARVYGAEGALAYASIAEWLRSAIFQTVLARLDQVWLVELARLLPELLIKQAGLPQPGPLTEPWQQQRLFEAMARAVLTLTDPQPLLLMIDDLHWCDRETLEWLHYLLRFEPQAPLLIVGTSRSEEMMSNHPLTSLVLELRSLDRLTEINLEPLDRADTLLLAELASGNKLPLDVTSRLYQETEGNPLFIVESVRVGLGRDAARPERKGDTQGLTATALPPKAQAVIESRLAQLSPEARELAGLAAAVGRAFTFELLAHLSERDEDILVRSLDELWQRRIVRELGANAYDFSHNKIQEVVYAQMGPARRRLLHRRVAQALEIVHHAHLTEVVGQIAHHYEQAGLLEQALSYYRQGAEQAEGIYAHHKAEAFYAQAITIARQLNRPAADITELYTRRGQILEHGGRYAEAIQVYQEFESLAHQRGDKRMEGAAIAQLVMASIKPSDVHNREQAEPLLKRGLALAREIRDPDLESQLLWSELIRAIYYGSSEEAEAAGEATISLARQHGLRQRLAYALNDLAGSLCLSGCQERGQAYAEEAAALFREQNNLPMLADHLNQQAWNAYHQLAFDRAFHYVAEGTRLGRELDNRWNLSFAAFIRGLTRSALGEWGTALADLAEGIRFGEEAGFLGGLTLIPLELGNLLREIGQIDQAQALHQQAHAAIERYAPFSLRIIEAHLAMDAFAAGQVTEGQRWLRAMQSRPILGVSGVAWNVMAHPARANVRAAAWTGEWELALAAVEQTISEAQRRRLPLYLPALNYEQGLCLAEMGRLAQAETAYRAAQAGAQGVGLRPVLWQTHAALARLYQSQNHPQEAEAERQIAVSILHELTDTLTDPAQRDSFLALPAVQAVLNSAPDS